MRFKLHLIFRTSKAPRGSTTVITDVVEISEVKRRNKNTALYFLLLVTMRPLKGGNDKRLKIKYRFLDTTYFYKSLSICLIFKSDFICVIAILFNRIYLSFCNTPSLINNALILSKFERTTNY
jgi:hypothetical protein